MRTRLSRIGAFLLIWAISGLTAAAQAPQTADLVEQLKNGTPAQKLAAADALGRDQSQAETVVPALIAALGDRDADVAWHAARSLGDLGPAAAPAVEALTKALSNSNEHVRARAALALGHIGEASNSAIEPIAKLVTDASLPVRRAAVLALSELKPPAKVMMPIMVKILSEADPAHLMPALHALAERGDEIVPRLMEALDHNQAAYWALVVLAEIGPPAAPAIPAIVKTLDSADPEVRAQAVMTLGAIGGPAKIAAPEIIKRLDDEQPTVRYAAAWALGKMQVKPAHDALHKAAEGGDPFMQMVASWALARIDPDNKPLQRQAVERLVKGLSNESQFVRQAAAQALFEMNADPEITAPAMVAAMKDADPQTQERVCQALASLGKSVVPRVVRGLQNTELRRKAAHVLALIGPDAAEAVPALTEALSVKDDLELVQNAVMALGRIGRPSAPAAGQLAELLKGDSSVATRSATIHALGEIGPDAALANDALRAISKEQDEFLRAASLWALVKINPKDDAVAAEVMPQLIRGLSQPQEMVRLESAAALGALGKKAEPAVGELERATKDSSPAVRAVAAEALEQIRGK